MISILTPTYNNGKYLKDFLDSVLAQTYADWELVLVNDGSTDNTTDILKNYSDSRIKYFYKEHTGISESLNYGYDRCNGEYIARADADDIMLPNRLQVQYNFMENHKDVDLLGNAAYLRVENEHNIKDYKMGMNTCYITYEECLRTTPLWHGNWIVRGTTWRRDKIYYDTTLVCSEDFEYMLHCMSCGWKLFNNGNTLTAIKRQNMNGNFMSHTRLVHDEYNKIKNKYKK